MSATTIVTCPAGTITGITPGDGTRRFHSIPYSELESPYADPRPRRGGEEIDATVARPEAIALSVTCPDTATRDKPVVVYIHGGRFEEGTHEDPRVDGALYSSDVIVVQIGYRVMLEGLARFHDDEPNRYRAIDDCLIGLEWVQKNIESFGGDPTNVTLVGQSAGASIAAWLCRRDHYRGAFRRVLAASASFPRRGWHDRKKLLRGMLGKPLTRAALTKVNDRKIAKAYGRFRTLVGTDIALGPWPLETAAMADVDIVVTTTRDELYHEPSVRWLDEHGLGPAMVRLSARALGLSGTTASYLEAARAIDPDRLGGRLIGDAVIRRWSQYLADGAPGRVWMAEFRGVDKPALHCAELAPLFASGGCSAENSLHRWLVEFARTGEPGWQPYHEDTGRQAMDISLVDGQFTPTRDPLRYVRLAFPDAYSAKALRKR